MLEYYTKFVGKEEVESLVKRFELSKFLGTWQQVLTSRTTALFGTGITYSSVEANYTLKPFEKIGVENKAYDTDFKLTTINGISEARIPEVPTCRIVKFDTVHFPGDYWIIYISPDFTTIIVAAPLILPIVPISISDNFGVYVLAKNREEFWKSERETKAVFDALKKYGFTNIINKPISSGKTYEFKN